MACFRPPSAVRHFSSHTDPFTESVQNWFLRLHQNPPKKKFFAKVGAWIEGFFTGEDAPPTEAELAQQNLALVHAAMTDFVQLLGLPYFESPAHMKAFLPSLTRCHFFQREARKVLDTLCHLAATNSDFSTYPDAMRAYLTDQMVGLVDQIFVSVLYDLLKFKQLLLALMDSLGASVLGDKLVKRLYVRLSGDTETPTLATVLSHSGHWTSLLKCRLASVVGGLGVVNSNPTSLLSMIEHVRRLIMTLAHSIIDGSIFLVTLAQIEPNCMPLLEMAQELRCQPIAQTLERQFTLLRRFDQSMREAAHFLHALCNRSIDAQVLSQKQNIIAELNRQGTLTFAQADRFLSMDFVPYRDVCAKLYATRESGLLYVNHIGINV